MHPEDIKAGLRKRFGTVRAFEAAKGLPSDSTRDVLRGRSSKRTAVAIATALGMKLTAVFPGRFTDRAENISQKRDAHRINRAAV